MIRISATRSQAMPGIADLIDHHSDAVLAIDIGGTTLKGAAFDRTGNVLARHTIGSFTVDGDVLSGILSLVAHLKEATELLGFDVHQIGLASPGMVDSAAGVVHYAPNLRWESLQLKSILQEKFAANVCLDHDARAGAWAERSAHSNASGEFDHFAFVPIGTGVSTALITSGSLMPGFTSGSGELGHISTDRNGETCVCGQRGCVEAYASANSILLRYQRLGGTGARSTPEIVNLLDSDPIAQQVWTDAVNALAHGISALTALFDPSVVIIGGGLSGAGSRLLDPLRSALGEQLSWRRRPRLAQSRLGAQSGLVGAALLGWQSELPVSSDFADTASASLEEWSTTATGHSSVSQNRD